MFRDIYKNTMDDIAPEDGLLEKILSNKSTERKRKFKSIRIYAALVAAAVVVVMAAAAYTDLYDLHKQHITEDIDKTEYTGQELGQKAEVEESEGIADFSEYKTEEDLKLEEAYSDESPQENEEVTKDAEPETENSENAEELISESEADGGEEAFYEANDNAVSSNVLEDSVETDSSEQKQETHAGENASSGGSSLAASGGGSFKNDTTDEFDYSSVFHENAQLSGFLNNGGKKVNTAGGALELAKSEVGADGKYHISRDNTAGVWRVCFNCVTEIIYVYISDDGKTLMIAKENI